jgi:hypothetical protein
LTLSRDEEQLNLLSTFHYVVAGICALCWGTFPLLHLFMGLMVMRTDFPQPHDGPALPFTPREFGALFVVIAGVLIAVGWTMGILLFVAARNLRRRTRYQYCFVIAAISCVLMPFGTVLGIFTLIVLNRPAVKELFVAPVNAAPL